MDIRELMCDADLRKAFPVMNHLRPYLSEETFLQRVREMQLQGYRLFALMESHQIRALAGIAIMTNLYDGRHVWVYDLVADPAVQYGGHGTKLLTFVHDFARDNGCTGVALSSGFAREGAHRFYEARMGYQRAGYTFKLKL